MRELIQTFPQQLKAALKSNKIKGKAISNSDIRSVIVCGMGGSGIGGKVVSEWVKDELNVPYLPHNGYGLPHFANEETLVVISSYSGNTEETLSAMESALAKGCQVACVTSGGKVKDWSEKYDLPYIEIIGGLPPRSQFGQSTVQLCRILEAYGLIEYGIFEKIYTAAEKLEGLQKKIEKEAYGIAMHINGSTPVVYSSSDYEGVAVRWRQQIGENGKTLCWHHQFPEMNHNDLIGWEGGNENFSAILLRNSDDPQRVKIRMDICSEIFKSKGSFVAEVESKGDNTVERSLYLVHLGDYVSLHLAEINHIDPVDIKNIDFLKSKLAEIK